MLVERAVKAPGPLALVRVDVVLGPDRPEVARPIPGRQNLRKAPFLKER